MAESIISPAVYLRENDISFIAPAPAEPGAAFVGPTVKGPVEVPTVVTSYNEYVRKFGETFLSSSTSYEFLTSIAVRNYFSQGGKTALISRVVSGADAFKAAENTFISGAAFGPYSASATQPFTLYTLGKGALYNNATSSFHAIQNVNYSNADGSLVSGSADNFRWDITNVDNKLGTFTLLLRQGNDSTNNPIILETFSNLSLDPNAPNYIEAVIGTQYTELDGDSAENFYVKTVGSYPNRSKYIRVQVNRSTPNYLANDGLTVNVDTSRVSYSASLPNTGSGAFFAGAGVVKAGATFFEQIGNDTETQGLVAASYTKVLSVLSNKDDYQFNIITAPGTLQSTTVGSNIIQQVVSLAEQRGDCIAVVDMVPTGSQVSNVVDEAKELNSSYAATYWPWVQVRSATGKNVFVPASTVIPGVYAFTDNASAPWFAPAGLTRGGLAGVIQAERKLTKTDRDVLYSGKVNPIATFPGSGISVFGQKTLQTKASALDRVNVRRLLIELKKFIGDQAKNLVFEQNSVATRNRFLAAVNPYLESVVQREGLYAYRVVMDDTNNTADVVDRNQLVGQIYIQPTRTIEYVVLDFVVEPTGVTFA